MKMKLYGALSVLAVSAAFATDPVPAAEPVDAGAPVVAAPAEETTPVAAPAVGASEQAPSAETPAPEASVPEVSAVEAAPAEDEFAPQTVRNGETSATVESPKAESPAVSETAVEMEPTAPVAVRGADGQTGDQSAVRQIYYERVSVGPDGIPVRTIYVAQAPQHRDSTNLDELMGLVPMTFKIGAQGFVGTYYLSNTDNNRNGESFDGLTWRAGVSAIIPLNEYTMGIKLGLLYEQSYASENYYINEVPTNFRFEQKKLNIPVLFTFKASNSSFFFDMGAQVSIPLADELEVSFTEEKTSKKIKSKLDMMDKDYRNPIDWSMVFGFSIMANKYISLDIRADVGLSNIYEGALEYIGLNLSASTFGIGVTLYPF